MWQHYAGGSGSDLNLSSSMESIMGAIPGGIEKQWPKCTAKDTWEEIDKKLQTTLDSPWHLGIGQVTFTYDAKCDNGCITWTVSFGDDYDFDMKALGKRALVNEFKTDLVKLADIVVRCGWKPYHLTGTGTGKIGTSCCD
jgi:hypothetical protein